MTMMLPIPGTMEAPANAVCERRRAPRFPVSLAAWLWRADAEMPIAIRLIDHGDHSVGFICPVGLAEGDVIAIALERNGERHCGLRVTHCTALDGHTFRAGACSGGV